MPSFSQQGYKQHSQLGPGTRRQLVSPWCRPSRLPVWLLVVGASRRALSHKKAPGKGCPALWGSTAPMLPAAQGHTWVVGSLLGEPSAGLSPLLLQPLHGAGTAVPQEQVGPAPSQSPPRAPMLCPKQAVQPGGEASGRSHKLEWCVALAASVSPATK